MIVKTHGGYKAASESGRPLSKKPKSHIDAIRQLYGVEMSQMRRGKKSKAEVRSDVARAARA